MKRGKSLTELAAEIDRQRRAKRDLLAPADMILMDVVEATEEAGVPTPVIRTKVTAGDAQEWEQFAIAATAHQQLAGYTGIPKRYYDRMLDEDPSLLMDNVNTWMRKSGEDGDVRLLRTLDGAARAVLSDRYHVLDNDLVLEAGLQGLCHLRDEEGIDFEVESTEVTERRMYASAFFPSLTRDVADLIESGRHERPSEPIVVRAGIEFGNSEIGSGTAFVQPKLLILACFNGLVIAESGARRHHVGRRREGDEYGVEINYQDDTIRVDNAAFLLRFRDAITSLASDTWVRAAAGQIAAANGDRIPEDAKAKHVVEVTAKRLALTEGESDGVLEHLLRGGDLSRWGLCQAITRHATDVETYDRSNDLERMGGKVVAMPQRDWQSVVREAVKLTVAA